jgi:hypothetical protein
MTNQTAKQQAKKAPKFILQMDGLGLYVAEKQGLSGCNLTDNKNKALKYSVGFDNPSDKSLVWSVKAKIMMNISDVSFSVVNL